MSGTFSIDVDPSRNLVRITLAGFFEGGDMARFLAARAAAHTKLTGPANSHVTVADVREMKIQTQDMVIAFQRLLADSAYQSRRLAFVTAPTLARTQLMRALDGRRVRLFGSHAEAAAWVFAHDAGPVAA